MTPTQEILFGGFPRDAATPTRFPLFSSNHFDSFVEKANGKHNLYCSIARYDYPKYYCGKIFYDFDAEWDGLFPAEVHPPEKFQMMRRDPKLAHEFLGEVIEEAKRLVRQSYKEGIPVVGAFTGKGLHVYQLYEERENPREEMLSTATKYREELNLNHLDPKPIGDVMRISRIPGSQRIWDGNPCPLYTTPLSAAEMREMDAEWLLKVSEAPRTIQVEEPEDRPEMTVYEDYLRSFSPKVRQQEFDPEEAGLDDEFLEWFIRRVVKMPCVSERALTTGPPHEVRLNLAIHLFNSGLGPETVLKIISRMNWSDFDMEFTRNQLNQIYRSGYSEFGCRRMRDEGLCVHPKNPRECPAYGWKNDGNCRWGT